MTDNHPIDLPTWIRERFDSWEKFTAEQWRAHELFHREEAKALVLKTEELSRHLQMLNGHMEKAIRDRQDFVTKDNYAAMLEWKETVEMRFNRTAGRVEIIAFFIVNVLALLALFFR